MKTSSSTVILFAVAAFCLGLSASAGAVPLQAWPTVSRGDQDAVVRTLQLLLTARGYTVSADGSFGRATQRALRQFQQAHQLVASGETNNPTWEALVLPLHQGSKGPAVRAAQIELREYGYAVVTDGVFGPRMKGLVQRYQRQTGHTADGIIGRNTWYELLGGGEPEGD